MDVTECQSRSKGATTVYAVFTNKRTLVEVRWKAVQERGTSD